MSLFFRKLKRRTKRLISFCIFVALIGSGYIYRAKVIEQYNHTRAYYFVWRGDEEYKKSNFQGAVTFYNIALQLYPDHSKAHYNLGNIYSAYEDYYSAVDCYRNALSIAPKFINAHINLGIILTQQIFDFDGALKEYKSVVDAKYNVIKIPFVYNNENYINFGKSIAFYNMGLTYRAKSLLYDSATYESMQNLELAKDSYLKALKIEPDSYDTVYNLALTLHLLGDYTKAQKYYCKAIKLSPLNYESHYNFAVLLKQKSLYKESMSELQKAGLILDANGDGARSTYIYQVLNEITQRYFATNKAKYVHLKENISNVAENANSDENKDSAKEDDVTYLEGKVVSTDDLDKAILENMKTCSLCEEDGEQTNKE